MRVRKSRPLPLGWRLTISASSRPFSAVTSSLNATTRRYWRFRPFSPSAIPRRSVRFLKSAAAASGLAATGPFALASADIGAAAGGSSAVIPGLVDCGRRQNPVAAPAAKPASMETTRRAGVFIRFMVGQNHEREKLDQPRRAFHPPCGENASGPPVGGYGGVFPRECRASQSESREIRTGCRS